MHTIIKIAVVSVLALFAIVGVVSISKAEYTVNSNGTHYNKKYRIDGKFALPLKSIISSHEWRTRLNSFMTNFYAVGDFNNDKVLDFFVTAMRHDDKKIASVDKGVNVYEHKISKLRFSKCSLGIQVQDGVIPIIKRVERILQIYLLKINKWQELQTTKLILKDHW